MPDLVVLILMGLFTTVSGYLINQLPELKDLPGRHWRVLRMLVWVTALGIILAAMDAKPELIQWLRLGSAVFGTLLVVEIVQLGQLWWTRRNSRLADDLVTEAGRDYRQDLLNALTDEFRDRRRNNLPLRESLIESLNSSNSSVGLANLAAEEQPERVGQSRNIPAEANPDANSLVETQLQRGLRQLWSQITQFPVSLLGRSTNPPSPEPPQNSEDISFQALVTAVAEQRVQRLLILGEPGSGKTTLLTEMAVTLLEQAQSSVPEADNKARIPILLELSAWQTALLSLPDWVVLQLKDRYNIPLVVGYRWLETRQLVLLFDGLDELGYVGQRQAIERINQFVAKDHYPNLIVCCRRHDFEIGGELLTALDQAVYLQALSDGQIQRFLQDIQRGYVWDEIQQSSELKALLDEPFDPTTGQPTGLRSPLLLSMLVIARQENTPIRSQSDLFEAYIQQRFTRYQQKHNAPPFEPDQTRHYLTWLAVQLKADNRTEFSLEHLQPNWLTAIWQRWLYRLIVGLIGRADSLKKENARKSYSLVQPTLAKNHKLGVTELLFC